MRSEYAQFLKEAENSVEYWAQTATLDFTEELARLMKEQEVSRSELARRIGARPPYITKVLRGNANFTLATMAKLARALGSVVRVHLSPDGVVVRWQHEHVNQTTNAESEQGEYNIYPALGFTPKGEDQHQDAIA